MRAVVQRVLRAEVRVGGETVGRIGPGMLILAAVKKRDTPEDAQALAEKLVQLRIFADETGKINRSLLDVGGEILCVSQFTLYGDCHKGRRPGYERAARAEDAAQLFEQFLSALRALAPKVETGRFQAMMEVELVNDGPVTLLVDSEKQF